MTTESVAARCPVSAGINHASRLSADPSSAAFINIRDGGTDDVERGVTD